MAALVEGSPDEVREPVEIERSKLRDAHVGLYLVMRFIAMCFTITMISTFLAESLLNTLRTSKQLLANGHAWVKGNPLFEMIRNLYPDGNEVITLINSDLVAVYIFTILVYAIFRFTYYKAVRDDGVESPIGRLSWKNLQGQPIGIRFCWFFSFRHGVHKKFFLMWMIYVFLFGITTAIGSLFGIGIYISPMLKVALYGAGAAFCFGLLEDLKVFQKIPPKEAIVGTILALVEGAKHADFSGTVKRIEKISSNMGTGIEYAQIRSLMDSVIEVMDKKQRESTPPPS